ncbi:hypothetical protein OHW08_15095 [Acinetobacter baumannii]|nr:hypothetical protein [Acinetobacter baumannii]MDC4928376.1 hypothetical protein [Acinetobacter baumannii]MDC4969712.1 hypothetical protein [Acinetobacter baumannii]
MNQKIKGLLIDTCGWITSICIIFFFFTLWLYSYNKIDQPLKEAWSLTISMLSALATIGAAIIAATLFNDWKEQEKYNQKNESINKVIASAEDLEKLINSMKIPLSQFNVKMIKKEAFFSFLLETYSKIEDNSSNIFNNLNHLAGISNKGFLSDKLFMEFEKQYLKISNKLEEIIRKINTLEPGSEEFFELRDIIQDIKSYINSDLIKKLRSGLRKF